MNGTPCRRAWLVLGSLSVDLEDTTAGYFCQSLDLGYPAPREVTSNRPDTDGTDDTTALMGARVVTANITALSGAGAVIDQVAASFAPFMVPSARPVLHYVLDRPGDPERTLTLRANGFTWPVVGPFQRDIQLSFVAPDPICRDPNEQESSASSGSTTGAGRSYSLAFPRTYPASGGGARPGTILSTGDVPVKPRLLFYGPITWPIATFFDGATVIGRIYFSQATTINAGTYIEVDCSKRTLYTNGDHSQPAMALLDWIQTTWPVIPPGRPIQFTLAGSTTSGATQLQAYWHNGFLT